ncbi:MAG: alpha-mannosidase [Phycisphaerae bacterium]|nr:alpha-mannosidase [Phycisphaerae bacterium]
MLPDRLLAAASGLARFTRVEPLHAEAFQSVDPLALAEARRAALRPVSPGWRWGPVWSFAWFRLTGRVPEPSAGRAHLRFSSGSEALLYLDDTPYHGIDDNHTLIPLPDTLRGEADFLIQAECIRPLGATTFFWDSPAEHRRWAEPDPGRFEFADLVVLDPVADRLRVLLEFAADLLRTTPDDREQQAEMSALALAAERALAMLDRPADAAEILEAALVALPAPANVRTRCLAVGHAHIDTAWLWTTAHTRRKCLRTFASALRLMESDPAFTFTCTQPVLYDWLARDSPDLFAQVARRLREGRWEYSGATWIEPDCNIPSGESLIRQLLHARDHARRTFPDADPPDFLFLPDTFGFPATLPQIIAQAGLRTFITNKLAWNDTNRFPHSTFLWRGLDGTEVLSHCTPGHEYNATNTPRELRRAHDNLLRSLPDCVRPDTPVSPRPASFLQPFGYGDGGGGPTADMLLRARLADRCPALPAVRLGTIRQFCDGLHASRRDAEPARNPLPVHAGDLYLERHRGTYTTHAWLKRANHHAEQRLRVAEWLLVANPARTPPSAEQRDRLDHAWKLLLLNQFHDILPGSSIGPVYADTRRDLAQVESHADALIRDAARYWRSAVPGDAVLNPASFARTGVVEHRGTLHLAHAVPALGVATLPAPDSLPPGVAPAHAVGLVLSNGLLRAQLDRAGAIRCLRRAHTVGRDGRPGLGPELCAHSGTCHVALFADTPRHWEAWDIDLEHSRTRRDLTHAAARVSLVRAGPLRAAIEFERPIGRESRMVVRYTLDAGSPRLDVRCRVWWRERRTLARARFATSFGAEYATVGVQFGHVRRSLSARTSHDRARFEVPVHRWASVSDPRGGAGLAVLTRGIYGLSCLDGVMGLTLLRGTMFPDPEADMGEHEMEFAIMPHGGDWRSAGVVEEAEAFGTPMFVSEGEAGRDGGAAWAPIALDVDGPARVEVSAFKPGERGEGVVVRLVEVGGEAGVARVRWGFGVREVRAVDVLERPMEVAGLRHEGGMTTVPMGAFKIVTLLARAD